MCFSPEISLATFIAGFIGSCLLLFQSSKFFTLLGIFFGFVSFMQLIEYFLWNHQVCDDYHKTLSIAGMILNHLQPVVLGIATWSIYQTNGLLIMIVLAIYLAVIIPYSLNYVQETNLHCTTPTSGNPHLIWNWNIMKYRDLVYGIFILTFVIIGLVGINQLKNGIQFSIGAILTFGLSALIYDRSVIGSLWCFWVVFIPAALLLKGQIAHILH